MTLAEQAELRVELARKLGAVPQHWIATEAAAAAAGVDGAELVGLPVRIGQPRSEWGLDLISVAGAGHA